MLPSFCQGRQEPIDVIGSAAHLAEILMHQEGIAIWVGLAVAGSIFVRCDKVLNRLERINLICLLVRPQA